MLHGIFELLDNPNVSGSTSGVLLHHMPFSAKCIQSWVIQVAQWLLYHRVFGLDVCATVREDTLSVATCDKVPLSLFLVSAAVVATFAHKERTDSLNWKLSSVIHHCNRGVLLVGCDGALERLWVRKPR